MREMNFPAYWKVVRLGDVCNIVMGQSPPSTTYTDGGVGMPFLQGKAEFTELFPVPTKYCTKRIKVSPKGSVLMSVRAPVGDVNLADRRYIIGRGLTSINLKCGNNRFLFYLLLHKKKDFEAKSSGSTFKSINKATINDFRITLPPRREQRAIAHVLQTIQEAKFARQHEIALERERKAALMDYLFSHGTKGEPRKQTEIGEIPESWKVVKFAKTVEIARGQVDPRQEPYSNMIHVGPENIESSTGRLIAENTNEELKIRSGNYYFAAREILYSKIRPYLNKVALPKFEGTCSADMYPLRPYKKHFETKFLFQFLLSRRFNIQAISYQNRTGIPKINRAQLGSIFLLKPPLLEQAEISEVLQAFDKKIATLEQEVAHIDELFHTMLDELMTGQRSAVPLLDAE